MFASDKAIRTMSDDETPPERALQPPLLSGAYQELYPSLRPRLAKILKSDDPALRAKLAAVTAAIARRERERENWLGQRYRLTPAEARLAAHIAAGGTVAGYAALSGVAEGTARTHLKAVFAKTGVHRQSDLIRLLAADR